MPYPFVRLPQCREKKKLKIQPCYFFFLFFKHCLKHWLFLTYYINLLYKAYFSSFTRWKSVSNSKKQILIKSLLHENTFWEINCWIYSSLWNASAVTLVYVFSAGCFYKAFLSPTSFNFLPMLPTSALLYYISLSHFWPFSSFVLHFPFIISPSPSTCRNDPFLLSLNWRETQSCDSKYRDQMVCLEKLCWLRWTDLPALLYKKRSEATMFMKSWQSQDRFWSWNWSSVSLLKEISLVCALTPGLFGRSCSVIFLLYIFLFFALTCYLILQVQLGRSHAASQFWDPPSTPEWRSSGDRFWRAPEFQQEWKQYVNFQLRLPNLCYR